MQPAAKAGLPAFIDALRSPDAYAHEVGPIEVVETHISWVILTGRYAYKIKKPLDLGFLDFSTLQLREQACRDELRLNTRLAPELYLDVVPLTGSASEPLVDGPGEAFEYAVKMRQFPGDQQLDRLLAAGHLEREDIVAAARRIAAFHAAAPADPPAGLGTPQAVLAPVAENFRQIRARPAAGRSEVLEALESWSREHFDRLESVLARRRAQGAVRECHGDLHLANLVRLHTQIVPFDCIEFDPALRWIDVVCDLAFLIMDLLYRGRRDLAYTCLDAWLCESGDYAGVEVLRFYLVYRALVRTKVALIRVGQAVSAEAAQAAKEAEDHLALAARLARARRPVLILMHGLSGSGKSTVSSELVAARGCVRLRSDVERKRLAGLAADESARAAPGTGLYSRAMSEKTYAHLLELAATVLGAGEDVIVDAAFLRACQRAPFAALAQRLGVKIVLVECRADQAELEARLTRRMAENHDVSDADIRVLRAQLERIETVAESEGFAVLTVKHTGTEAMADLVSSLRALAATGPGGLSR